MGETLKQRLHWLLLIIPAIYGLGYLFEYMQTPLGQVPVLDGLENFILAEQMATGTLPDEPFYRAPLYPALLAVFFKLGLEQSAVLFLAQLMGIALHVANALLVYKLALRLWGHRPAALFAELIYGLYPVAVYFAADPLDITLGMTFMLVAANALAEIVRREPVPPRHLEDTWEPPPPPRAVRLSLVAGALLGLSVLTRPHFLTLLVAAPVILFFGTLSLRKAVRLGGCTWLTGFGLLVLFGFVQLGLSGQFKVLPWQGAYNMYAANKPGAHGKFYTQQNFFKKDGQHRNPARMEAELLYAQETGKQPPFDIGEQSAFWRKKFLARVAEDPGGWLGQMTAKGYFLLNNYEQYNNKTYSYHKERSNLLRFNPLNWGVLLILGAGGWVFGCWDNSRGVRLLGLTALVYAAGVMLFYVSARFRLPLAPLLCAGVGGWPLYSKTRDQLHDFFDDIPAAYRGLFFAGIVFLGFATYTNFYSVKDDSTAVQDAMLVANAAARMGEDLLAYETARQVLDLHIDRPDAIRVTTLSYLNLALTSEEETTGDGWGDQLKLLLKLDEPADDLRLMTGLAYWHTGKSTLSEGIWNALVQENSPEAGRAMAALIFTGLTEPKPADYNARNASDPWLRAALWQNSRNLLLPLLPGDASPEQLDNSAATLQGLFDREYDYDIY